MTDNDIRTTAAHMAAALKTLIEEDVDAIPDLPTGKRERPAASRLAAPDSRQSAPPRDPATKGSVAAQPAARNRFTPLTATKKTAAVPDSFIETLPNDLAALREQVAECRRCMLHRERAGTVFGEGPVNPTLMIVGGAPGPLEDKSGRPFCGEEGELLGRIVKAMGLDREKDCYLTTLLKCRFDESRPIDPETVELCRPYLKKQIELVKPRYLVAMGQIPAMVMAGSTSITRLRGQLRPYDDISMLVTYHPTALLKEPALKKLVWADVKLIMASLEG